jgi:hypothetical protein
MELRKRSIDSWLTPEGSLRLGLRLGERLVRELHGEDRVMVTLTYRREEYDSPLDLYRHTREKRHIRGFLRRLGKLTGEDYAGRWLCKMEFQRGGWVHYHMVIRGTKRIEHTLLDEAWGYGFVYITRAPGHRLKYLCKYVAKDCSAPDFLYNERMRSVRIITSARGFWSDTEKQPPRDEPEHRPRLSAYQPIGMALYKYQGHCVSRNDRGHYMTHTDPVHVVFAAATSLGAKVITTERGWIQFDRRVDLGSRAWGHAIRAARVAALAAAPPLYLKDSGVKAKGYELQWHEHVMRSVAA